MERKVRIAVPPENKQVDGVEVAVLEATERWTDIKLEDGTVLRLKPSVLSAVRITGQYDQAGNPAYALRSVNTMVVFEAPEHLKRAAVEAAAKRPQ